MYPQLAGARGLQPGVAHLDKVVLQVVQGRHVVLKHHVLVEPENETPPLISVSSNSIGLSWYIAIDPLLKS